MRPSGQGANPSKNDHIQNCLPVFLRGKLNQRFCKKKERWCKSVFVAEIQLIVAKFQHHPSFLVAQPRHHADLRYGLTR